MPKKPSAIDRTAEEILPSCGGGGPHALDIKLAELTAALEVAIDPFFTMEELDQLAREAGFTMRASKLKGSIFF
jgi:hypothetical protein